MIFIAARFLVKPEHADAWSAITEEFTRATRSESGNLWFDWSRSLDNPNEYILLEAFTDDGGESHVNSEHFQKATRELPGYLQATPKVRNVRMSGDGWDELGEMAVD